MDMKTIKMADIRSWKPCYDLARHLAEDWEGTVLDILKHDTISPQDKLWVVCREDLIDAKTLRLFAVWCARQVQHLMTDERSIAALEVAERYANGKATDDELAAARAAARYDAGSARAAVAWDAAARDAAAWAAWAAAMDAAPAAAPAAARAARDAAAWAAWAAAMDARAARAAVAWAQIKRLIEMLEE
jgi:hypothetical protein